MGTRGKTHGDSVDKAPARRLNKKVITTIALVLCRLQRFTDELADLFFVGNASRAFNFQWALGCDQC